MTDMNGTAPQAAQTVQLPMPAVPLPLTVFSNPVPMQDGSMTVMIWAMNPAGSQTIGVLDADTAQKFGRQLMAQGREAGLRLTVMPKGLAMPDGSVHLVAPETPAETDDEA